MDHDHDPPEDWVSHAVDQAFVLREIVQDHPDLRDLVDALLFKLGQRIAKQIADEKS